jgi:PiT family inorganic phosphate transporter
MTILLLVVVLAVIFDYINGFHDAANSIATVVTTRVLTPFQAVIWAAFFNFVAYFIVVHFLGGFGDSVANTVAKTVHPDAITSEIIIAGLVAAILWNLLTWWFGIPSSSSHTLIGGFAGAALAGNALDFGVINGSAIGITALFIVAAPLLGLFSGVLVTIITIHTVKHSTQKKADKWFKRLQLVSSAALSISHGLNDSQKVMGIICAALIANQAIPDLPHWMTMSSMNNVPQWIPLTCFSAIALGTMSGGYKIMKTMGNRITRITPLEGFCAQTAGAITLFFSSIFAIPVSTTHTITGSIMGVGAVKRLSAVRWGVSISLLWAWVLTIPVSACLAALVYFLIHLGVTLF